MLKSCIFHCTINGSVAASAIGTKDCLKLYLWMLSGFALLIAWFCILDIGDTSPLTAFCFALIRMLALSDGEQWSKWGSSCSEEIQYFIVSPSEHQNYIRVCFPVGKIITIMNWASCLMWFCSVLILNTLIQKSTLMNIYQQYKFIMYVLMLYVLFACRTQANDIWIWISFLS